MSRNVRNRTFGRVPSEDSGQYAFAQSDLNLYCVHLGLLTKGAKFHHLDFEDSDQTARTRMLFSSLLGEHFSRYVFVRCGS